MKGRVLRLLCVVIVSALLVLCLYIVSQNKDTPRNGFIRAADSSALGQFHVIDLKFNSYYFAGFSGQELYLGNERAARHLLLVDSTKVTAVNVQGTFNSPLLHSKISIDSPYFYLMDLVSYEIYRGELDTYELAALIHPASFFSEVVYPSPHSRILRTISKMSHEYVLTKETVNEKNPLEVSGLLEKQVDGLFCTDGMLHYNAQLNCVVYVYYYRNQFMTMDSSLTLSYRANTIDTTTHARIKVAQIKSEGSVTLAAPPLVVNRRSSVYGERLFIESTLLADNEDQKTFQENSAIDVYNLHDGTYQFSFYLPHYNGHKMRHFAVYGNYLYSLHDRFLIKHRLFL